MEQETRTDRRRPVSSPVTFWLATWLGTVGAGGVFGGVVEGPLGVPPGFVFAGLFAVPVVVVAAILTWCFWLSRYRVVMAALAGAATGVASSIALNSDGLVDLPVPLAGLLGAVGGGAVGGLHWWRSRAFVSGRESDGYSAWQFTMREMFLRITVFSVVLALVSSVAVGLRSLREQERRATCEYSLRRLALGLESYQATYGSLPPVVLVDKSGVPVLSWRVPAFKYIAYDVAFFANMDLSKAWNDPVNKPFLSRLSDRAIQCPSMGRDGTVGTTHYVAVTGPGTYWTEVGRIDEDAPQEAILAIEWPPSDIHWAEPRDVSPDEFVAWFQSTSPPPRRVHPGGLHYINGRGVVCSLPWDIEAGELRRMLKPRAK